MEKISRKERERLMHRDGILQAAEKCFAAKGFSSTTMTEIAEAAEFSVGALYQFFQSKEEIYISILTEKVKRWIGEIEKALAEEKDPIEKIRKVSRRFCEVLKENEQFFRILAFEVRMSIDPKTSQFAPARDFHERQITMLEKVFIEGIRKKVFRKMPPRQMALIFTEMLHFTAGGWILGVRNGPVEEYFDFALEIFLHGVTPR